MASQPRNLVICSDGTGNSGRGADGTNAWRMRQAVNAFQGSHDEQTPVQDVIYHDGVGTEAFTPKRILGLAISYGVTRDLEYLYERLMLQYRPGDENKPGDQLYLFGFSRGAFTIRTLAYILYRCGLASPFEGDGETRRSLNEIREIAKQAVRAYKMRHLNHDEAFRKKYGIPDRLAPQNEDLRGRVPIRFVGVWDTVSAVGLPFHNFTQFFLQFWRAVTMCPLLRFLKLSLLNLQRPTNQYWTDWENDLHPRIENAFQAIAIDDERDTFYPMLWVEQEECPDCSSEKGPRDDCSCQPILAQRMPTFRLSVRQKEVRARRLSATNVEQVWFAGMHSNVGGGYEKDHLAHISLVWMMDHAENCGLRFDSNLKAHYRHMADPLGKMHDSRSGLGMLYRYNPRDLEWFARDAGFGTVSSSDNAPSPDVPLPLIHKTVFDRIRDSSQSYAPALLPETGGYRIVGNPPEVAGDEPSRSTLINIPERDCLAQRTTTSDDSNESAAIRRSARETIQLYIVLRRAAARWVVYVILIALLLAGSGLRHKSVVADHAIFGSIGNIYQAFHAWYGTFAPSSQQHVPPIVIVPLVSGVLLGAVLISAGFWGRRRNPGKSSLQYYSARRSLFGNVLAGLLVFLAGFVLRPLAHLAVEAFAPQAAADRLEGIMQSNVAFGSLCFVVYVVLWFNNHYRLRIMSWSRYAWDSVIYGKAQEPEAFRVFPRTWVDWLFSERCGGPGRYIGRAATRYWYPLMSMTLLAGAVLFLCWIPVAELLTRSSLQYTNLTDSGINRGEVWHVAQTFPTGKKVIQGHHYVVNVEIREDLLDATVPGDLSGIDLTITPDSELNLLTDKEERNRLAALNKAKKSMKVAGAFKRLPSVAYFQLCGSIGSPTAPGFAITPGKAFTAPSSGPLYLFVNDVPGFSVNNTGKLKVTIDPVESTD